MSLSAEICSYMRGSRPEKVERKNVPFVATQILTNSQAPSRKPLSIMLTKAPDNYCVLYAANKGENIDGMVYVDEEDDEGVDIDASYPVRIKKGQAAVFWVKDKGGRKHEIYVEYDNDGSAFDETSNPREPIPLGV